jgi:hypothetical protein
LPLGEPGGVGDVREHLVRWAGDVDGRDDGGHGDLLSAFLRRLLDGSGGLVDDMTDGGGTM